jgi:hypothetical protein
MDAAVIRDTDNFGEFRVEKGLSPVVEADSPHEWIFPENLVQHLLKCQGRHKA